MGLKKRSKKSGGSGCQPGEHLKNILIAHDFIKFFIKSKINIFEAAKPLYENKLTIPEISKKLNIPAIAHGQRILA